MLWPMPPGSSTRSTRGPFLEPLFLLPSLWQAGVTGHRTKKPTKSRLLLHKGGVTLSTPGYRVTPACAVSHHTLLCREEPVSAQSPSAWLRPVFCTLLGSKPPALCSVPDVLRTSSTRTAIMAAAPVETVQSIRMTWSSLMSFGSRR